MLKVPYIVSLNSYNKFTYEVKPFVNSHVLDQNQDLEGVSNFLKVTQHWEANSGTAPPKVRAINVVLWV